MLSHNSSEEKKNNTHVWKQKVAWREKTQIMYKYLKFVPECSIWVHVVCVWLTLLSLSGVAATWSSNSSSVRTLTNSSPSAAGKKTTKIYTHAHKHTSVYATYVLSHRCWKREQFAAGAHVWFPPCWDHNDNILVCLQLIALQRVGALLILVFVPN